MEEHVQGTWVMMNSNKRHYTFFQRRNTTNNDYMEDFDDYGKSVKSYGVRTPIQPGIVKAKII